MRDTFLKWSWAGLKKKDFVVSIAFRAFLRLKNTIATTRICWLPGGNTSISQETIPQEKPIFKPAHPHFHLRLSHNYLTIAYNNPTEWPWPLFSALTIGAHLKQLTWWIYLEQFLMRQRKLSTSRSVRPNQFWTVMNARSLQFVARSAWLVRLIRG